jgi:methylenetetrahydrofolate reductase (NADPH)
VPGQFKEAAKSERILISAELTLRRESTADDLRRQADSLGPDVDGFQINENPYAWLQMSTLSAAAILAEHGVDPVPIVTCRDRNRRALDSELRGLQALGVTSLILMRGPRVPKQHAIAASTVFDLTGMELISLARQLGKESGTEAGSDWFIGAAAQVFRPKQSWRAESLAARADAGAGFVQTQLCLNSDMLREYMEAYAAAGPGKRLPVVVSMTPLPSPVTARWIRKTMTGSRIPEAAISRLEDARDPVREGIRICAECMQEAASIPGVAGINLLTTGDPRALPDVIRASGLRD